jgi:hypothetical protein
MPSHALFQFGSIALDPAPHGRVISAQPTLDQQFFYITERQGISKIPTDCAKDDFGFALPPFEDCWAFSHWGLFTLSVTSRRNVATQPSN